jgi:hypothetical protein
MHDRHGWTLRWEAGYRDLTPLFQSSPYAYAPLARYWLDGLHVTLDEANALIGSRPRGSDVSYLASSRDFLRLDNVELTPQEAQLIRGGASPLAVLLAGPPQLIVRSLSMAELMSQ